MQIKKFLIGILLALTACIPTSSEPSIFQDQLCGKACWNDIVVGKTEAQELLGKIAKIPGVNKDTITVLSEPSGIFDGSVLFSLYEGKTNKLPLVNVSIYTKSQKVAAIIFNGSLGIEFQDVVKAFDEPEFVSAVWYPGGGINVNFIDSQQGIEFGYVAKSEASNISPDVKLNTFTLFDSNLYQKLLESNWLTPGYDEFTLYPWSGYGKIEDYYWPPRKP